MSDREHDVFAGAKVGEYTIFCIVCNIASVLLNQFVQWCGSDVYDHANCPFFASCGSFIKAVSFVAELKV